MGCDIHCYLEYRDPDQQGWESFGGRINPGRNYRLFSALAGVRGDDPPPVVSPRGYPDDAAYAAESDYWLYINDTITDGSSCTREQAEQYARHGCRFKNAGRYISSPDWHSHSWLTPDEYAKAIEGNSNVEYRAILAALHSFEKDGHQARLVFWFDN